MYVTGTLVTCVFCSEDGYLGDEVFLHDLPTATGALSPLCLDCAPEDDDEELAQNE